MAHRCAIVPGAAFTSKAGDALAGRNAVVTGAASGIGAATARRFHAAGASVALIARRAARLHASLVSSIALRAGALRI